MREQGFRFACGMMSPPARAMMGLFGLELEILGAERMYWNEPRAPVRFSLMSATRLLAGAQGGHPQAARTSAVFAPPKPNELDST
jgi:hypothetical protein